MIISDNYTALCEGVIKQAAKDALEGNPEAFGWLLGDQAPDYAELAGIRDGFLGTLASRVLEGVQHGN